MDQISLNKLLDELRSIDGENEWIEYKLNKMDPEEIGKYISALANGACLTKQKFGFLVFGIENETKVIKGTKAFLKKQKKGNEDLEHWISQRLSPKLDFKVFDFKRDNLKLSMIQIPAATSQPVKFLKNGFVRVGSITRNLLEFPEKEKKIWRNEAYTTFESMVVSNSVTDSELQNLLSFETYFELLNLPIPTSFNQIVEKFSDENLIVKNGLNYDITNLGALLFARDLNQFDGLFRKSIRVIVYKGQNRIETEREYTGRRGYALAFARLIEFLDTLLPKNEVIEKALRKEVTVYPEPALRELIANAIIHQNFDIPGAGPMIEVFADRIEINNPGKPLIDVLRFIDHSPQSRNEKLAYFMRRLNICEERGSGIDKVIDACEVFQLPAPEFLVGTDYTRVKLFSPKSLRQMEKADKIRACYQHCCLKYVSNDKMTNTTLRKRFNIAERNYPMASRIIADTIKADLIKDADPENKSRKHAKYVPFWA